jgi:hypothetical protein
MECYMMSRERAAAVARALGAIYPRLAQTIATYGYSVRGRLTKSKRSACRTCA